MTILSNFGSADTAIISPATFTFAFPKSINGAPQDNEFYVKTVLLSAVRGRVPAEYSGFSGKIFRPETAADYASPSSTDPTNKTELDDFSTKFATDWLVWQFNRIDAVLSGVVDWEPDGFGDLIFDLSSGNITTRVFGDQPYPKDSVVRTAGTFGSITTIYNVFNNSTNIYNSYYYNNVTNVFNTNFYITNLTVNNFTTNIFNFYGCNDLVNTGVRFNFIDNIKCDDDGYYYYRLNEFKQTYDYTGCPVTTITKLGLIPFGCCDLSCVPDPPPPPWEYCCEDYPDELCGVFYPINDDGGDCNCATSFVVKFDHPGITATYWGGTWNDGSIWMATKFIDTVGCLEDCCYYFDDPGTVGYQIYIAHSGNPYEGHKPSVGIGNGAIAFQASCLETTIRYANFNTGTTVINGMKITVIPNTALPSDEDSISDENVSICLTLIDGCYVGSVELDGTTCTVEICCVGTATDPLQYEANLVHDSVPYGPFLAVSVQCGLTDFALDFGIINISGRNYRFVCFVDDTGTCCDGDSSSTPVGDCDPGVDHGYGQYGWTWQPGGYWIHEEGDVNECTGGGIPSYPPGDGTGYYDGEGNWVGIHTTTYCCPP